MPILNRGACDSHTIRRQHNWNIASAFCKAPTPNSPSYEEARFSRVNWERGGTRRRKEWTLAFPLLLLSLKSKLVWALEKRYGGSGFDIRLDWTFYSCQWNWSDSSKWLESNEISLKHHQEVKLNFFYKNVCEERMIPTYAPLQWQKEPKPNSQNLSENGWFHMLQPRVFSMIRLAGRDC